MIRLIAAMIALGISIDSLAEDDHMMPGVEGD
jgi:hypothetical protein